LDQPLVGSSPNECHSKLLAAISPALCSVLPKGADFFGISHPTIQNLIQSSPGTRKLAMYKQQRFEVRVNRSEYISEKHHEINYFLNFLKSYLIHLYIYRNHISYFR